MILRCNLTATFCYFAFALSFIFCTPGLHAQTGKFTVVIDAGHGGHDPGAMGSFAKEKDINLAISLRVADLIQNNFSDVKVVLTRKNDVFLPLQERADIVNENNANLFICIHTNSSESSAAYGAETFTLGLAKSKSNLDVAMRENSVILLEKDYKTKYRGFDPNSVDSYIMFEFMQDKYIDKSIDFAQDIQKQFTYFCKRTDRGVRQAGFWVLHRSACPSVLVEVGFVSNPSEERYLTSDNGRQEIATGIYNAFVKFKKEYDKKSGKFVSDKNYELITKTPEKESNNTENNLPTDTQKNTIANPAPEKNASETTVIATSINLKDKIKSEIDSKNRKPVFKVQILASDIKLKNTSSEFKGLPNVEVFEENKIYKYTVGAETDFSKIVAIRKQVLSKFPHAFIIAFLGDQKITPKEALNMQKDKQN